MATLDYLVAGCAVVLLLATGLLASRRGGRNTGDFILAGRRLPWWLAGSAMVAGGSNADSPLHQSGKIRREGLAGAWFYWSQIFAFVWHSLVFSRLWRRTALNTVVEYYDLRYGGRAAVFGRLWSMVFASLLGGTLSLALGLLAMIKISVVLLGLHEPVVVLGFAVNPELAIVIAGVILAVGYSTVAGLLGVVAGDMVEFLLAMVCSYLLMFFVYREAGYGEGLREGLARLGRSEALSWTPAAGISLVVFFFVQPFASLAGENALNQRFLALRDERQAMLSGVWRLINHYFFRCWPWYICGLASIVLLTDTGLPSEMAYPRLIVDYMPAGLRGLMFGGFLVAFMSSVSSAMHNCGSVFVNDFYRPYIMPRATERHYVWAIRAAMLATAIAATAIALASNQILRLLQIAMTIVGAGGLAMLLRWFWWRVNGWADLAAQVCSLPVTLFYTYGAGRGWVAHVSAALGSRSADDSYGLAFLLTVGTNTCIWVVVMFLTPPEQPAKLAAFYRRVRPYGFWGPVARQCPDVVITDRFRHDLLLYVLGLALALGLLFGMGFLLLGRLPAGLALVALGIGAGWLLVRRIGTRAEPGPETAAP